MLKSARYICEAVLVYILYFFFRVLPVDWASATGGRIARLIGPRLAASRKAMKNLNRVFPEYSAQQKKDILKGMWENLGRVVGEYPHLSYLAENRVKGRSIEGLKDVKNDPRPVFFISGHIANWELLPLYATRHCGYIYSLYRAPNNPYVRRLLARIRDKKSQGLIPKSRSGTRKMVKALKDGANIGVLFDQKYNEGVAVPFLGEEAMTSDTFIHLARKYDAKVIPGLIRRDQGAHFTFTLLSPLSLYDETGDPRLTYDVLKDANEILEDFIRENPSQWLWLHRRWPKDE